MAHDSPITWDETGAPRSARHGDVYFSADGGLDESRAVFLAGCGLPEAWCGRRRFTVGEIGFGTGLNIAALLDLWRGQGTPDAWLNIFSIEAAPLSRDEARRALAHWPELSGVASLLVERWPGRARGLHRVDLPELRATLDLYVGEAAEALREWTGRADAWFLDGFSPALNPDAWRDEVLGLVGERSAPGARAATFTVAGAVRRGLEAAGFAVAKAPGFGRKRQRLEARMPGEAEDHPQPGRIAIIGAGIAGASLARAFESNSQNVTLIDADGAGSGASGNPLALVNLRLDAGLGPPAALFARGLARAGNLYEAAPGVVLGRGAHQLMSAERDGRRFAAIAASDLFEAGAVTLEDGALAIAEARTIAPASLLQAWAPRVQPGRVSHLERSEAAWRLIGGDGRLILEADTVIVAAAHGSAGLLPGISLQAVRGQVSWAKAELASFATGWGGYALAARGLMVFGATFDPDDEARDVRAEDHHRNLRSLAGALPSLAAGVDPASLEGRASIRAAAPDRLPIAGPAPGMPGVYVLTGLGSRGFTLAPLLGEHVAALITGAPSPLAASQAALVDPARFAERAARRTRLASKPSSR
ncbi:MAG: tRNA (5-methylaminomethyl-2-thiouridine)(34)-methyltransferase MnmD [Caulobacteraceae bacterium]